MACWVIGRVGLWDFWVGRLSHLGCYRLFTNVEMYQRCTNIFHVNLSNNEVLKVSKSIPRCEAGLKDYGTDLFLYLFVHFTLPVKSYETTTVVILGYSE